MELVDFLHRTIVSDEQNHFSVLEFLLNAPEGSQERENRRSETERRIVEHFELFFNSLNVYTDLMVTCHFYDGKFMIDDRFSILFKGWTDTESMNRLKLKDFQSYEFLKSIGMIIHNANK